MIDALGRDVTIVPLLPVPLLAVLALAGAALAAWACWRRAPGWGWRAAGCALLLLWLAGPRRVIRTGTSLPDIVVLAVDRSGSMQVDHRAALAEAAARRLTEDAAARSDVQVRRVDVAEAGTDGTQLFASIDAALAEIPAGQRAGVIAITDGVASDVPATFDGPLHVLIPARGEQTDRRLRITQAPGYGIVGQSVRIGFVVDDLGPTPQGATVELDWSQDGAAPVPVNVVVGQPSSIDVPISRAGRSTVSLSVATLPGEASLLNNRAALVINGVRDRLRVLLISGQPHAGERTWRRLLKADPAVDLVHFTILRPPGKDDLTPVDQLALIAFPVRELFVDKIGQFDLIILDRFGDPGILPSVYLRNIADYVRNGGALLVSAGPEFAAAGSIANGPLGDILPAAPLEGDDAVVTGGFRPAVTALGERHPVTASLAGDVPGGEPRWGEWYRRIAIGAAHGQVVLSAGVGGAPLLLLDHVGDGRVALLLSDQIWLWSRGHQGGGPQAELLRRVAHWLMKEPELDENALTARVDHGVLAVQRHAITPADPGLQAVVTDPDGVESRWSFGPDQGGQALSVPASVPGLWQVRYGDQHAYAAAEPADPAEYADLRATGERLRAVANSVRWLDPSGAPGLDQLRLRRQHAMRLTSLATRPLLPSWVVMPFILLIFVGGWWRESRD